MTLRGPSDADRFRTKVYGARWYIDPLPADDVWPATDERWPAVSTIKKGWSTPYRKRLDNGNTYPLDAVRVAEAALDRLDVLAKLPREEALAMLAGAAEADLGRAAGRGTDVHSLCEDLLAGRRPRLDLYPGATAYRDVVEKMLGELALDVEALEVVLISRTHGHGGTGDVIARVPGLGSGRYKLDFKTRNDHRAYDSDAVQIGGYLLGDYMVVEGDDGLARREPLGDIDGGLILTITENDWEAHPIAAAEATDAWLDLRECWDRKRDGQSKARSAIGQPQSAIIQAHASAHALTSPAVAEDDEAALTARCERLRARVAHIIEAGHADTLLRDWPTGVSTLKENPQPRPLWRIEAIEALCAQVEKVCEVPYGDEVDGTLEFDHPKIQALIPRLAALPQDLLERVTGPAMHPGTDDDWEAVPNLRTGKVTSHHLATIERFLAPIEVEHEARKGFIESERIALDSEEWWSALVQVVGPEPATWTALQVETLEGLLHAITAEILTIDDDRAVVPTATAADRLVAVVGPKRQINARAKDFAGRLGIDPPRSADDVLATPALCGLVVAEAMGGPAEEAAVSAA